MPGGGFAAQSRVVEASSFSIRAGIHTPGRGDRSDWSGFSVELVLTTLLI